MALGAPGMIGCLHFGHPFIARLRGFQDEYQHDEYLIEQYNSVVGRKDLVYILGDITMENPDYYYQLDRLNGRKIVVLGNHDKPKDVPELLKYVESVAGMIKYKGCFLTHAPIHPSEVSFCRFNLHSHIHSNELHQVYVPERYEPESTGSKGTLHKYINVDAGLIDFKPKTLEQLIGNG